MISIPNTIEPTQVRYPWRATLRTIVQVGIPALLTAVTVLPLVIQIVLDELGEVMPESLRLWLVAAAGFVTALAAAFTRIMAIPAVNAVLTRIGLGAKPAQ